MKFRNSKVRKNQQTQQYPSFQQEEQLGMSNIQSNKSSILGENKNYLNKKRLERAAEDKGFDCQFQKLNRSAVEKINQGLCQEAEFLLNQAQKLLQQAVSNGKTANTAYIITIFHNQICRHQQSWQIELCVSYVQAIIYNLKCQTEKGQKEKSVEFKADKLIELKSVLAHYYLLFCAFNSQLKQHDTALIAAKRSNNLLKDYFKQIHRNLNIKQVGLKQYVSQLIQFSFSIGYLQKRVLLQIIDGLLTLRRNKIEHPKSLFQELANQFQYFTIANIMQLQPILNFKVRGDQHYSKSHLLSKIIMFSMSYFTMATQLRLLAKKTLTEGIQLKETTQYKQSQCCHLMAIIIALYFIPFDFFYLQHLIESFKLHYSIQLTNFRPIISSLNCQSYSAIFQKIKSCIQDSKFVNDFYCKPPVFSQTVSQNFKLNQPKKQKIISIKDPRTKASSNSQHSNLLKGKSISTSQMHHHFNKKTRNSTSKSKKKQLKHGCVTSVQSPNKMSFSNTPRRLSPKCGSKHYPQQLSQIHSVTQRQEGNKVKAEVMHEYFDSAIKPKFSSNQLHFQKIHENQFNKQNKLATVDLNSQRPSVKEHGHKRSVKKQLLSKRKNQEENLNLKFSKSAAHLSKHKSK